jgi:hypothetical protein
MTKVTFFAAVALALVSILSLLLMGPLDIWNDDLDQRKPSTPETLHERPVRQAEAFDHQRAYDGIRSQLSSIEQRLKALERRDSVLSSLLPPAVPMPGRPPLQLPDGSEAPWAWIEKLDPGKRVSVEKAFGDAATAFRASVSEGTGLDHAKLEASMAQLEQDVARRLKSILSPQEFEDYLLSLPDDAQERLGFEKSDG